jgi:hypothetical protein
MSQPYFPQIELPAIISKLIKQNDSPIDFKVVSGITLSLLFAAYIAISQWQLSIGLTSAGIIGYVLVRKLKLARHQQIADSHVLFVPAAKLYVIPLIATSDTINTVRAVLTNGKVELTTSAYSFDRVETTDRVKTASRAELEIAQQVSYPLETMYQIDPKIEEFKQKIEELKQAKRLASLSEVYADKVLDYSKVISQIEETIENAKRLHHECFKLIGEILIGAELAKLNPDTISEPATWKLQFATRSTAITEQFQFLQDKERAYSELKK